MQLLDNPASPFCRKVKIVLHETGQSEQVDLIGVVGHPTDPVTAAKAHNPLGKIPTLLRDDGPAIYDSRVICRYLDSRAGGTLYPSTRLWETMTLEATADGMMDAAVLMVYERRSRPEAKQDDAWINAQWAKVSDALDALEARWMSHLSGPLDIGQIALACGLGYLDFRHPDRAWRDGHPHLSAWFEHMAERPSFAATQPPS